MKFSIMLTDFPWWFASRCHHSDTRFGGGATAQYSTMQTSALRGLRDYILDVTSDNAMLYMWTPGPLIDQAIDVGRYYGFEFITGAFYWIKTYPKQVMVSVLDPKTHKHLYYAHAVIVEPVYPNEHVEWDSFIDRRQPGVFLGPGYYEKANTEIVLQFKRGDKPNYFEPAVDDVSNVIIAPQPRVDNNKIWHSAKPPHVHARIERMYPSHRKISLFERELIPGWLCLGNEIDGKDIRDALQDVARMTEDDYMALNYAHPPIAIREELPLFDSPIGAIA